MPNFSQLRPIEMGCRPLPFLPRKEQHLNVQCHVNAMRLKGKGKGTCDSPATLYCEVNVVGVQLGIAFHKLNARKVLPVAHRLLEQRLMSAAEY